MHTSRWDGLLHHTETKLCISCHAADYDDEAATTYHRGIGGKACSNCHDPHFADNPGLLKPGIPGARSAAAEVDKEVGD
jgi:predicted CXXCH cytochrome family protein